jgi:diadenosine tetraphosphate (Ap4A) HIT family hydrolase
VTFSLDHRLADSSFHVEDWDLCRVCLKNDQNWPWLYLVPMRQDVREFCDLSAADQQTLMTEIARAQAALKALYSPDKINTAALGNMVPQLHIHIFARYTTDPAWPKPVWALDIAEQPYDPAARDAEIAKLRAHFAADNQQTDRQADPSKMAQGDKTACQR